MADRPVDKALQEFLAEAQDTVDTLGRALLRLDAQKEASGGAAIVNDAFRAVHSLKGLSGLFGVARMTTLAHDMESLLDGLRLGRVELTPVVLDLLFEGVEVFGRLVAQAGEPTRAPTVDRTVEDLAERIERMLTRPAPSLATAAASEYALEADVLAGLTEYEEHRLRECARLGRRLFRVRAAFPLAEIDKGLDEVKARLVALGEVITILPLPPDEHDAGTLALEVLVATTEAVAAVAGAVSDLGAQVAEVPRAGGPAPLVAAAVTAEPHVAVAAEAAGPAIAAGVPSLLDEIEERQALHRAAAQTVRVDIRRLDHLMNVVGELALVRAGIVAVLDEVRADKTRAHLARNLTAQVRSLDRRIDELQAGILEVRMVPLGQIFDKLSRVVRKIAREAGKNVHLHMSGADVELDKLIVEELSDPLMHVIRNSIDHGIEAPDRRRALGKPEEGRITVAAEQRGNHVVITVADDGAGIDETKLVRVAVERGFVGAAEARRLERRDRLNLMFLPGVSTKDVADSISGRGVGMDVVKTNIARLSGLIDVDSTPDEGTRLQVTLPVTLAIIQALVVRAAGRTYAVPLNSVLEAILLVPSEVRTIERRDVTTLRGATLPLLRLERAFRLTNPAPAPARQFAVVVGLAQHRVGIVVDELCGQQDVVVKPLGRALEGVPGVAGATELDVERTVLVLDVAALVEEALTLGEAAA